MHFESEFSKFSMLNLATRLIIYSLHAILAVYIDFECNDKIL